MNTRVLFFGTLSDIFGRERAVAVPEGGTSVAGLRELVVRTAPEAAALSGRGVRAAVDQRVAGEDDPVRPGQEVAFFSPVSGG